MSFQQSFHSYPTSANVHSGPPSHHSGRGRRAPRISQNSHKQYRSARKDEEATAIIKDFRHKFELARSFDVEDDNDFIPNLLSENERFSVDSSSDRSSLSSGSPESSPQSHRVAPDSTFTLNSNSNPYIPTYHSQQTPMKLHQPAATRVRNAIPIVNPTTRAEMSSPPQSVSPSRMQNLGRRW